MTETLRLIMPQWQGGNNPAYSLGAKLLAWLAPAANGTPQIEVPITAYDGRHCPWRAASLDVRYFCGSYRQLQK